jgi:hypothetical protein
MLVRTGFVLNPIKDVQGSGGARPHGGQRSVQSGNPPSIRARAISPSRVWKPRAIAA